MMAEVKARCELCEGTAPDPTSEEAKRWGIAKLDQRIALLCPECRGSKGRQQLEDQAGPRLGEPPSAEAVATQAANREWLSGVREGVGQEKREESVEDKIKRLSLRAGVPASDLLALALRPGISLAAVAAIEKATDAWLEIAEEAERSLQQTTDPVAVPLLRSVAEDSRALAREYLMRLADATSAASG
jgi:hypothetical protein